MIQILNAVVVFFVVDLVLRQALSRLESIAKYRTDSLSNNIRPALRLLTDIHQQKHCDEKSICRLMDLVDGIKPLPDVNLINSLNKLSRKGTYSVNESSLREVTNQLDVIFANEKKFVSFYGGPFSKMIMPGGLSLIMIIVFFALPLSWIPIGVGYGLGGIDLCWFIVAMLAAGVYEFYVRGKK